MDETHARVDLDRTAQQRAQVLNELGAGRLTAGEAASLLGVSVRQLRRLRGAYRRDGPAALVHGNQGRTPWHALSEEVRAHVIELARNRYAGLNYQHLTEKLAEVEHIHLDPTTVRKVVLAAGLRGPRTRRVPQHRRRRERLPREGQLLQADGSRHRWLGPDQPYLTLIGAIDDASGTVPAALFRAQEDAAGYLEMLRTIVLTKGVPNALYVDRHGIFRKSVREPWTLEEELAGGPLPTQFARALQELTIQLILALSPQAKGRVERLWGTLQDRLVAELRLAQVHTMEAANAFLPTFLQTFNTRFGVPPADPLLAYRPIPPTFDPERVFCFKYERTVRLDNTVTFGTHVLQLLPTAERASWARVRVEIDEHLDGSLAVLYHDRLLASTPAPPDTPTLRARHLPRPDQRLPRLSSQREPPNLPGPLSKANLQPSPQPARKPAPTHPWRRSLTSHRPTDDT